MSEGSKDHMTFLKPELDIILGRKVNGTWIIYRNKNSALPDFEKQKWFEF